ncbi:hypothetical protein LGL74_13755, partial [Staphylococcus aureus]|nr:hypothetical protein [Staphylococcus aureus]
MATQRGAAAKPFNRTTHLKAVLPRREEEEAAAEVDNHARNLQSRSGNRLHFKACAHLWLRRCPL